MDENMVLALWNKVGELGEVKDARGMGYTETWHKTLFDGTLSLTIDSGEMIDNYVSSAELGSGNVLSLASGQTYSITMDGKKYVCSCEGQVKEDGTFVYLLGDPMVIFGATSAEPPFFIAYNWPGEGVTGFARSGRHTSTKLTVEQSGERIHTIDPKFLTKVIGEDVWGDNLAMALYQAMTASDGKSEVSFSADGYALAEQYFDAERVQFYFQPYDMHFDCVITAKDYMSETPNRLWQIALSATVADGSKFMLFNVVVYFHADGLTVKTAYSLL